MHGNPDGAFAGISRRSWLSGVTAAATTLNLLAAPARSEGADGSRWLTLAEALRPRLLESEQTNFNIVRPVSDPSKYLRWRMDVEAPGTDLPQRLSRKGDAIVLDFGGHRTGYLQFRLVGEGVSVDSPCRLKLTFGEVSGDVAEPLFPYRGQLSSAWLPEEIVTVDLLPQLVRLPRRYAYRYVKIEVLDTSPHYAVRFFDVRSIAVTSARGEPRALPAIAPAWIRRVDEVSRATLRDCMQTTFEDGPRRDQRHWLATCGCRLAPVM